MQTIVPHFQMRGTGHLINVSSFLAKVPVAGIRSAYSASKAALSSQTANLRMDLSAHYPDIHVTLIARRVTDRTWMPGPRCVRQLPKS